MFSHIMVGTNDIARSKKFYDSVFAALGGKPGKEDAKGRLIYAHNGGIFMVSKPIDGKCSSFVYEYVVTQGICLSSKYARSAGSSTRPTINSASAPRSTSARTLSNMRVLSKPVVNTNTL